MQDYNELQNQGQWWKQGPGPIVLSLTKSDTFVFYKCITMNLNQHQTDHDDKLRLGCENVFKRSILHCHECVHLNYRHPMNVFSLS